MELCELLLKKIDFTSNTGVCYDMIYCMILERAIETSFKTGYPLNPPFCHDKFYCMIHEWAIYTSEICFILHGILLSGFTSYVHLDHEYDISSMSILNSLADHYGFVIKNIIPDGNCMFNAIVDQLRISGNYDFTPQSLRKAAVR